MTPTSTPTRMAQLSRLFNAISDSIGRGIDTLAMRYLGVSNDILDRTSDRARFIVVAALGMSLICAIGLLWGARGTPSPVFPELLPDISALSLWFGLVTGLALTYTVVRNGTLDRIAYLLPLTGVAVIGQYANVTGGLESPAITWLTTLPLAATFVAGWQGSAATALATLFTLEISYSSAYDHALLQESAAIAIDRARSLLYSNALLVGASMLFGWYVEQRGLVFTHSIREARHNLERASREIEAHREQLRQIAENIGHAVWLEDTDEGRVTYANGTVRTLLNVSPEALAKDAQAWQISIHADDIRNIPIEPNGEDHVYRVVVHGEERWLRHAIFRMDSAPHRLVHIVADATLSQQTDQLRTRFLATVIHVQETERRHLARELHDETGQVLTALLIGLRTLTVKLDPQGQMLAHTLSEQLRSVIQDLGRIARGLHPTVLDELGLAAGVQKLADDTCASHKLDIELDTQVDVNESNLDPGESLAMYRIIQEALTNIVRHARAHHVFITLHIGASRLEATIEDDGCGFNSAERTLPQTSLGSGLGLHGMKERAKLLGGEVTIESSGAHGTTIHASIPRAHPHRYTADAV